MHIYAFGSLCRGEVDFGSDVDVLAITEKFDARFDPDIFSIYSYERIQELWNQGNAFAWHLSAEAKLIFTSDNRNFLLELGAPAAYTRGAEDCKKFANVYRLAIQALQTEDCSLVFELSAVFLAIRNFATCYSLGVMKTPNFSRHSAKKLGGQSLDISDAAYQLLERSRILSTRGTGPMVKRDDLSACISDIGKISLWMEKLLTEINAYGRV